MQAGKALSKFKRIKHGHKHIIFMEDDGPLPEAGYAREETLKRRQDKLEAANEQAAAYVTAGVGQLNVKPEREILRYIDSLSVSNQQEGFVYAWVCEDYPSHAKGLKVTEKSTRPGWEVVRGDMPEARERLDVRGYRKIGDSILMRCPAKQEHRNKLMERGLLEAQRESITGKLEEVGVQAEKRGFARVHLDMNDPLVQAAIKRGVSAQLAGQQFDGMLREGRIPGIEVGT